MRTRNTTVVKATRCQGDNGSVFFEAVAVIPILLGLLSGLVDYGMAFRDRQVVQAALRNGARVASSAGNYGFYGAADKYALSTLYAGLAPLSRVSVNRVVIFRASPISWISATAEPLTGVPPECKTRPLNATGGTGIPSTAAEWSTSLNTTGTFCSIYSSQQLKDSTTTAFVSSGKTDGTCDSVGWDRFWCPPLRYRYFTSNNGFGPDYLGMYVNLTYTPLTGFYSKTITMEDTSILRVEPYVAT